MDADCIYVLQCCGVCMALIRYDERSEEGGSDTELAVYMDEHYDDAKMARIYPNAKTK